MIGLLLALVVVPTVQSQGAAPAPTQQTVAGVRQTADGGGGTLSIQDEALLHRVDDHYNDLASLQARYREHYTGLGMDREETGTLLLKKPGRMLWRYDSPAGKVFVLDGKHAWFYTPGDSQAQRISAKKIDDLRTPLRFLLGHTQLKKELEGISVTREGENSRISGVPRGMQNKVSRLSLLVNSTGGIASMDINEQDGAITEFSFTDMKENLPAKDSDFVFSPPAGVSVVDATPPI